MLMMLGCSTRFLVPTGAAVVDGPVWPRPPDAPQVRWVGGITPQHGGFQRPMDVGCGGGGLIAVADAGAGLVWLINTVNGQGFAVGDPDGTPLRSPVGVALDGVGGVLIADADRAAIYRGRTDKRAAVRAVVPEGQLFRPVAVLQRADGTVLVVDATAHQLVRLDTEAHVVPVSAGRGAAGHGLNFPVDVAVGPAGTMYVADAMNASVDLVLPDGSVEVFAGGALHRGATLLRPKGVAVDTRGNVHVVDGAMQHVVVFAADGRLLGRYGEPGDGPGQLGLPAGICIDGGGLIYVADSLNGRVQVYRLEAGS